MDELILTRRGIAPQFLTLTEASLTIGRDEDCDISLEGQAVSREHARLTKRGDVWFVTDLGSTNGSYLGGTKLNPNSEIEWQSGHPLQIGAFTLQWQSQQDVKGAQTLVLLPDQIEPLNLILQPQSDESLNLVLDSYSLTLAPGATGSLQLGVLSSDQRTKQLVVEVDGVPASWVEISHPTVTLLPKKHQSIKIKFNLPTGGSLHAAKRRFTVALRNTQEMQYSNSVTGTLNIMTQRSFDLQLDPPKVTNAGTAELIITNKGNVSTEYQIKREPVGRAVRVAGDIWDVALMPSTKMNLWFVLSAEKRHLFGSPITHTYKLTVTDSENTAKSVTGDLTIEPLIPTWVIGLLVVFLTIVVVALLLRFL
jgi:hypothetical protein